MVKVQHEKFGLPRTVKMVSEPLLSHEKCLLQLRERFKRNFA